VIVETIFYRSPTHPYPAASADGPLPFADVGVTAGALTAYSIALYKALTFESTEVVEVMLSESTTVSAYTPAPRVLPGFPGAYRDGHAGGRTRWKTPDGLILEWDSQHGELEVYDKRGRHKGSFDHETGEQIKDPIPGRRTRN